MKPFSFFQTAPKQSEAPSVQSQTTEVKGAPAEGAPVQETSIPDKVDFGSLFSEDSGDQGGEEPSGPVSITELIGKKDTLAQLGKQYDFSKMINKDLSDKIRAGDSDAIIQGMSAIASAVYTAGLRDSAQLIDHGTRSAFEISQRTGSKQMKELLSDQDFVRQNELFSDSMFTPVVAQLKSQLKKKYPKASNEWIANQVQDYFKSMAQKVNPSSVASDDPPERINFAKLLNLPETRNA